VVRWHHVPSAVSVGAPTLLPAPSPLAAVVAAPRFKGGIHCCVRCPRCARWWLVGCSITMRYPIKPIWSWRASLYNVYWTSLLVTGATTILDATRVPQVLSAPCSLAGASQCRVTPADTLASDPPNLLLWPCAGSCPATAYRAPFPRRGLRCQASSLCKRPGPACRGVQHAGMQVVAYVAGVLC
jgi:hypothetical protein